MKRTILPVLSFIILACLAGSAFAEPVKVQERKEVSQYGITWTFDKPVTSGQFITGDWWVAGPVTVTKIDPPPGKAGIEAGTIKKGVWGDTSLTEDTAMRNGFMVVKRCSYNQGFDSRSQTYGPSLSKKLPYVLEPSQSIISTISNKQIPVDNFCKNIMWASESKSQVVLKTAAVLTCLKEVPPEDAFRPSYVGEDKVIYREKDIKWELLPKLKPVGKVPSWEEFERYFQRPWIESMLEWGQQELNANENQPNYGREHSRLVSLASMLLSLDEPNEKKRKLLIGLMQYGIDLSGCGKNGGQWNWGGGHSSGRKWPVLFASMMLGAPDIYDLPPACFFHEDTQTYYGKGWFGQTVLWQMITHHGQRKTYEEKPPEKWEKWDKTSEGYRCCCNASAWIGTALMARHMKAIKLWGHDAYFDYIERWMRPDDPYKSARGKHPRPEQETTAYFDPFVTEMWKAHRKDAPVQEMSGNDKMFIWKGSKGRWVENKKP